MNTRDKIKANREQSYFNRNNIETVVVMTAFSVVGLFGETFIDWILK